MRAVNLLPDDKGREDAAGSRFLTTTTVLAGGAVLLAVVVAMLAFGYVSSHNKVSDRKHTLSGLQQQLADVQARRAAAEAAATAAQEAESADLTRMTAF